MSWRKVRLSSYHPKYVHFWTWASPKCHRSDRFRAFRMLGIPATFTRSSAHLVGGLPSSGTRLPLPNFPTSSVVSPASNAPRPLPLKFGNSSSYVGRFRSSADLFISDSITQGNSEYSPLNCPLDDFKLLERLIVSDIVSEP